MSLILAQGTIPKGLEIKTWGPVLGSPFNKTVFLGDYEISLEDFLAAAVYVLTNTSLEDDDPRREFVRCVSKATEREDPVTGGGKHFKIPGYSFFGE